MISVETIGHSKYRVTIAERGSQTVHEVTARTEDVARYAPGASAEELIQASFEFLLGREPKESILSRFDLTVIERYFPDYPSQIREML